MSRSLPFALLALLLASGCEQPLGSLAVDEGFEPAQTTDVDRFEDDERPDGPSAYVLGPEWITVYEGEVVEIDLELLEPEAFALRPGLMPEAAEFMALETGAQVRWATTSTDIGTHDFVMLVVDSAEPNLVIDQEIVSVDVVPRLKFIEYGF